MNFPARQRAAHEVLNTKLFDWPGHPNTKEYTIGDICRGVAVFGSTGSGKTSGSLKFIAKNLLANQFGGVVFCIKKDERKTWEDYLDETGRSGDKVIFDVDSNFQFNPLLYEVIREGDGANDTANLLEIMMKLYLMGQNFSAGGTSRADERFWEQAMRRALNRTIDLLKLSSQNITFMNIRKVIVSAPDKYDVDNYYTILRDVNNQQIASEEKEELAAELTDKKNKSFCLSCVIDAGLEEDFTEDEIETYKLVRGYFLKEFAELNERTRSIVVESALGIIEPFLSGILNKQFSKKVSDDIRPEKAFTEGKVIIVDFSVKEYGISGIYAMGIYKYMYQQTIEQRELNSPNETFRPVFMFTDEAHYLQLGESDTLFASTARSSLCAIINGSQNLPNYIMAMGSENAEARAKSLLANLTTHIFHANASYETNMYASKMIGKIRRNKETINLREDRRGDFSITEQLEDRFLPADFTILKTGDLENKAKVEGVVFQTGRKRIVDGEDQNYLVIEFDQNF